MRFSKRIHKCRCGQFTPVETALRTPPCSRCGGSDFTHVLWLDSEHKEPIWMQSAYSPDGEVSLASSCDIASVVECVTSQYIEEVGAKLSISRARALLDYLEMLRRGEEIDQRRYEEETQRVLQRVLRDLRK